MKDMTRCKNVFEAILRYGHDEDFVPNECLRGFFLEWVAAFRG